MSTIVMFGLNAKIHNNLNKKKVKPRPDGFGLTSAIYEKISIITKSLMIAEYIMASDQIHW